MKRGYIVLKTSGDIEVKEYGLDEDNEFFYSMKKELSCDFMKTWNFFKGNSHIPSMVAFFNGIAYEEFSDEGVNANIIATWIVNNSSLYAKPTYILGDVILCSMRFEGKSDVVFCPFDFSVATSIAKAAKEEWNSIANDRFPRPRNVPPEFADYPPFDNLEEIISNSISQQTNI